MKVKEPLWELVLAFHSVEAGSGIGGGYTVPDALPTRAILTLLESKQVGHCEPTGTAGFSRVAKIECFCQAVEIQTGLPSFKAVTADFACVFVELMA